MRKTIFLLFVEIIIFLAFFFSLNLSYSVIKFPRIILCILFLPAKIKYFFKKEKVSLNFYLCFIFSEKCQLIRNKIILMIRIKFSSSVEKREINCIITSCVEGKRVYLRNGPSRRCRSHLLLFKYYSIENSWVNSD